MFLQLTPMNNMRLNFDVLVETMSFLGRSDVGVLMRTCQTLRKAGAPYILDGDIRLNNNNKIASFCHFMLQRDSLGRFRYLRHLELSGRLLEFEESDLGKAIGCIFQNATHLESLVINDDGLFELDESISIAIASLPRLQKLELSFDNAEATDMMQRMQAPLVEVKIHFDHDYDDGDDVLDGFRDPIVYFAAIKETLEDVCVSGYAQFDRHSEAYQYPLVENLDIDVPHIFQPLKPMIEGYPNLRQLSIWTDSEVDFDDSAFFEFLVEAREGNLNDQETHGSWESLDVLSGELSGLYALGIQCKVEHLDLADARVKGETRCDALKELITDTTPSSLSLGIVPPEFNLLQLGTMLEPAINTLSSISLNVDFHGEGWVDPNGDLVS